MLCYSWTDFCFVCVVVEPESTDWVAREEKRAGRRWTALSHLFGFVLPLQLLPQVFSTVYIVCQLCHSFDHLCVYMCVFGCESSCSFSVFQLVPGGVVNQDVTFLTFLVEAFPRWFPEKRFYSS